MPARLLPPRHPSRASILIGALCGGLPAVLAQAPPAPAPVAPTPLEYRSPVAHPIRASGTFGELRADHFHMGLDVKSARGRSGDALYAVAEGYVSRIKISAAGYGNAVYLDHPDGTRSLYAHLETLAPDLQAVTDSVHYAEEAFEIDVRLPPRRLPVTRGQRLGTMGNTGSSFGAHLHFERRLASTDAAVNPQLTPGIDVRDGRAPDITGLSVYHVDGDGTPGLLRRLTPVGSGGGAYRIDEPVRVPAGRIAFGLAAVDRVEGQRNRNGVFRTTVTVGAGEAAREVWRVTYDTIAYEDSRYIQAHYDFGAKAAGEGYTYRLHRLPGDRLPIYETAVDDGTVVLGFGDSRPVEISTEDARGNRSVLRFTVEGTDQRLERGLAPFNFVVGPGEARELRLGDARFAVPAGAAYAKTFLAGAIRPAGLSGALSSCYDLGDETHPIHDAVRVTVPLARVPEALRGKAYFGPCDPDPSDDDADGRWRVMTSEPSADGATLTGELEEWRPFAVYVDTVAPTVREIGPGVWHIEDDVTAARALRYRVTEEGRWVLAAFDAKRNRLEVRADKWQGGALRVEVSDEAGNRTHVGP